MAVVSMSYLLEAGVHFGHQTKRWNPKMKDYIFGAREDIYIIDLEKTSELLEVAYNELKTISENGGKVLSPLKKIGTFSSTLAVQTTLVSPISINTDPSEYLI